MAPPLEKKPTPLSFTLSHGLDGTNRRFVYVGQATFLTGSLSTIYKLGHFFSDRNSQSHDLAVKPFTLSSSGVARRAMYLSYALYRKAGADILFIEAPESEHEIETIAQAFRGTPLLFDWAEGGKRRRFHWSACASSAFELSSFRFLLC
jgi:hypothetical protein